MIDRSRKFMAAFLVLMLGFIFSCSESGGEVKIDKDNADHKVEIEKEMKINFQFGTSPRIQLLCSNIYGANIEWHVDKSLSIHEINDDEISGHSMLAIDKDLDIAVFIFIADDQDNDKINTIQVNPENKLALFYIIRMDDTSGWNEANNIKEMHTSNNLLRKCKSGDDSIISFIGNFNVTYNPDGSISSLIDGALISKDPPSISKPLLKKRVQSFQQEIDILNNTELPLSEVMTQRKKLVEKNINSIAEVLLNEQNRPCIIYDCMLLLDRTVDGSKNPFKDLP